MKLVAEAWNRGQRFVGPNPRFLHSSSVGRKKGFVEPKSDKERLGLGLPLREPWFEVKPFNEKKKSFILGLKEILISQPSRSIEVADLGQLREELDVLKAGKQKKIAVFVRKYPRAFSLQSCYNHNNWKKTWCRFTIEAEKLLEEEEKILEQSEPRLVAKLRKVLMMSMKKRIRVDALERVRQSLGLPFDYSERLVKKYPQFFALKERKGWLYVELRGDWEEGLAVSTVEENEMAPDDGNLKKKKKKKKRHATGLEDGIALQSTIEASDEEIRSNDTPTEKEMQAIVAKKLGDIPRLITSKDPDYVCAGLSTDDSEDVQVGISRDNLDTVQIGMSVDDLEDMGQSLRQRIQIEEGDDVEQGRSTEDLKVVHSNSYQKISIDDQELGRRRRSTDDSEAAHGANLKEDYEYVGGGMPTDDLEDVRQDSHQEAPIENGECAHQGTLTKDSGDYTQTKIPVQEGEYICESTSTDNLTYVLRFSCQGTLIEDDGQYVEDSESTTANISDGSDLSLRERNCLRFPWKTKRGLQPRRKKAEMIEEFQSLPYISPYKNARDLDLPPPTSLQSEKFVVAMVHEFLSLTLEKRARIDQLEKLRKPYRLPDHLMDLLIKYDGIFYVVKGEKKSHVFLKEAYKESLLVEKDPLVIWQEQFVEFCLSSSTNQDEAMKCKVVGLEKKKPVFKGFYYKGSDEYFGKEGYKVPFLKSKS